MPNHDCERARALVGTRFRPQGRCSEGLDCVGLVIATFGIEPAEVRRNYRLSHADREEMERTLKRFFRTVPIASARPGDVLLMAVNERQLHLGVRTAAGFVHAHAGIGRVVETPGEPQWDLVGVFRKRSRSEG